MVDATAQRVTEYVLEQAGTGLRTVVILHENGFTPSYIRDDLKEQYDEAEYAKVIDTFRTERPFLAPDVENDPVGERRGILHYHENACVLQLPYSETESILISVSRDAGRELVGFIEACREIVQDSAP